MYSAKYVTANGEEINLNKHPYFLLADNELHDYEWEYENNGIAITSIKRGRGIKTIPFSIFIYTSSRQAASQEKNAITSIFEKDVVAQTPGRLYIGKRYLKGFVIASKKSDWFESKRQLTLSINFLTDRPIWCEENTTIYRKSAFVNTENDLIDYPYNFPYNYTAVSSPILINNSSTDAGFIIRIYGPAENPSIVINNNIYQINCSVAEGEQLIITSSGSEKSIILKTTTGQTINKFADRNIEYNNFLGIPVGQNTVSWNYGFDFDITVISERSEPEWI
ncbi:MAG: hypothetical protein IJT84_03550 [Clostridia bacterium]|nr:hypothetical protein [Clostridia bacterium]